MCNPVLKGEKSVSSRCAAVIQPPPLRSSWSGGLIPPPVDNPPGSGPSAREPTKALLVTPASISYPATFQIAENRRINFIGLG